MVLLALEDRAPFRTVKPSGLDLGSALVEHGEKLRKLATLAVMAAIQAVQLPQARDGASQQNIPDCFSRDAAGLVQKLNPEPEGKALKQKAPSARPPALATWGIAKLGGWKGLKTHRPLGIKTISRGLLAFFQIKNAAAFLEHNPVRSTTGCRPAGAFRSEIFVLD